jgi:hypothetical protein
MNDKVAINGGILLFVFIGASSSIDAVDAFYGKLFTWLIFSGFILWLTYWLIKEFGPDRATSRDVRDVNLENATAAGLLQALEKINPGAKNEKKTATEVELKNRLDALVRAKLGLKQ